MFTYNGTAVLQFDNALTGNAASGALVTVRVATNPVAGLGALALIYDFNGVAIGNPLTADSKGNYSVQAIDGTYDLIIKEGDPQEVILPSVQFVDISDITIAAVSERVVLADGQTTVTFAIETNKEVRPIAALSALGLIKVIEE